jgi:hypothetical protein
MNSLRELKKLVNNNLEILMKTFFISFIITMFLRCVKDIITQ